MKQKSRSVPKKEITDNTKMCRKCKIDEREDFGNVGLSYYCKKCLRKYWETEYFD